MNRVWRLIGSLGGSKMAEAFFITLATDTIIDIISAPLYSALLQSQYQPLKVDNPNLYTLLLNDSRNLYIDTSDIRSNELGGLFLNACTGLYFLLAIDEPTDLQYNPEEWNTPIRTSTSAPGETK